MTYFPKSFYITNKGVNLKKKAAWSWRRTDVACKMPLRELKSDVKVWCHLLDLTCVHPQHHVRQERSIPDHFERRHVYLRYQHKIYSFFFSNSRIFPGTVLPIISVCVFLFHDFSKKNNMAPSNIEEMLCDVICFEDDINNLLHTQRNSDLSQAYLCRNAAIDTLC